MSSKLLKGAVKRNKNNLSAISLEFDHAFQISRQGMRRSCTDVAHITLSRYSTKVWQWK